MDQARGLAGLHLASAHPAVQGGVLRRGALELLAPDVEFVGGVLGRRILAVKSFSSALMSPRPRPTVRVSSAPAATTAALQSGCTVASSAARHRVPNWAGPTPRASIAADPQTAAWR